MAMESVGETSPVRSRFIHPNPMTRIIAFPFPCPSSYHSPLPIVPPRMTHPKTVQCPFLSASFQHEVAKGTCCTMDQRPLIHVLIEYGDVDLVRAVSGRVTAEEATGLSKDLVRCADWSFPDLEIDDDRPEVRRALRRDEIVRISADWYWQLGTAGYGVDVGTA